MTNIQIVRKHLDIKVRINRYLCIVGIEAHTVIQYLKLNG